MKPPICVVTRPEHVSLCPFRPGNDSSGVCGEAEPSPFSAPIAMRENPGAPARVAGRNYRRVPAGTPGLFSRPQRTRQDLAGHLEAPYQPRSAPKLQRLAVEMSLTVGDRGLVIRRAEGGEMLDMPGVRIDEIETVIEHALPFDQRERKDSSLSRQHAIKGWRFVIPSTARMNEGQPRSMRLRSTASRGLI